MTNAQHFFARQCFEEVDGKREKVKNGMKPLKENTLNEIGVFPIQNYIKGIIPSSELQIMNDKDREKVKSLIFTSSAFITILLTPVSFP